MTELSRSVWENLDLGRVYRPYCVRSVLTTSVKILPYRPPVRLIRAKYRACYNIELDDVNRLVVKNTSSYSLRKSLNIVVSRPQTEQGRRSFKHRAAIAWNSLHDSIRQLENPLSFKRKVKSIKSYIRDISFQKECSVNYNKNPDFNYF